MSGFTIATVLPVREMESLLARNLHSYISRTGANFVTYYEEDLLHESAHKMPDLLFIDHRYCQRTGELESYLKLPTKIVLLTTSDRKGQIEPLAEMIDKVVYKPINLTKTFKALEVVYSEKNKELSSNQNEQTDNTLFEGIHILVAEDNAINQKLIINVLNKLGVEVTLANNGEEALHLRQENNYDMIFMDVQMPVMGGIEATQEILAYEEKNRKHHIPIIALTANALQGDREKYIDAGMDDYLSKPLVLEHLTQLLKSYFADRVVDKKTTESEVKADDTENKPIHQEVKDDEKTIETNTELQSDEEKQEESSVLAKEKSMDEKQTIEADILLHNETALSTSVYEILLKNLGYTVDIADSPTEMVDKIENKQYRFVLFDANSFSKIHCLISDMIRDAGATPFIIVSEKESGKVCCETLSIKPDAQEIKKKLETST